MGCGATAALLFVAACAAAPDPARPAGDDPPTLGVELRPVDVPRFPRPTEPTPTDDPPDDTGVDATPHTGVPDDGCPSRAPLDPTDVRDVQDALRAYQLLRSGFGTARLGDVQGDATCPALTETVSGDVRTRTWTGGCTAATGVRFEGTAVEVHRAMTWPVMPVVRLETTSWRADGLAGGRSVASSGVWRSNREVDPFPEGIFLERFEGTLAGTFAEAWAPHGVEVTGFEQLVERVGDVEWHTFSGTVHLRCRSVLSGQVRVAKNEHHHHTGRPNLGEVDLTVEGRQLTLDWSEDDGFGCWPVRVDGVVATTLCH